MISWFQLYITNIEYAAISIMQDKFRSQREVGKKIRALRVSRQENFNPSLSRSDAEASQFTPFSWHHLAHAGVVIDPKSMPGRSIACISRRDDP